MRSFIAPALTGALLVLSAAAHGAITYTYQDGAITDTQSINGYGGGDAWLANQFLTVTGGEAITSITIGYGPNLANVALSLLLYHDQNANGLPDDLLLLKRVDITLGPYAPIGSAVSTFQTESFAPVAVGDSFFVAALLFNAALNTDFRVDATAPHGQSWIGVNGTANGFDPANPNTASDPPVTLASLGANVDLMLTANGEPGTRLEPVTVPEPGTMVLTAAAIGMLALRCWAGSSKRA